MGHNEFSRKYDEVKTVVCEDSPDTDRRYECRVIHGHGGPEQSGTGTEHVEGFVMKDDIEFRGTAEGHSIVGGGSTYRRRGDGVTFYVRDAECRIDTVDRLVCTDGF